MNTATAAVPTAGYPLEPDSPVPSSASNPDVVAVPDQVQSRHPGGKGTPRSGKHRPGRAPFHHTAGVKYYDLVGARTTDPITGNIINASATSAGSHSTRGNPVGTVCGSLASVTRAAPAEPDADHAAPKPAVANCC